MVVLPPAAAIFVADLPAPRQAAANTGFMALSKVCGADMRLDERIAAFLQGGGAAASSEWCDHDGVEARHFAVRLALVELQGA